VEEIQVTFAVIAIENIEMFIGCSSISFSWLFRCAIDSFFELKEQAFSIPLAFYCRKYWTTNVAYHDDFILADSIDHFDLYL
jgi:hypothetical protein